MIPTAKFKHLLQQATVHHSSGRLEQAETLYRQLIAMSPRSAVVHDLLGQLEMSRGRSREAVRWFLQACQHEPKAPAYGVRLALAWMAAQQPEEAEKVLRRLTQTSPRHADAWNALGYVLKSRGRLADALSCHDRAVTLNPQLVEGWYHYGHALALGGKNFQALTCYDCALKLNPRFVLARFGRAQALQKTYRLQEAVAEYDAVLAADPRHHDARSCRLFALQNLEGVTRERLIEEHRAYGAAVGADPGFASQGDAPDRRVRLAIVSPDLRTHSCAYFIEPLLRHLDAAQFELYLYHDHFTEDEVSARLKKLAVVWRNFAGQPPAAVERTIRDDRPDILIDLAGHIGTSIRLPLFARRLAPVQVTYLGYPDTTGVAAMDFRFTDALADPVGESDRFHTEKLVRFSSCAWSYLPPLDAPAVAPAPVAATGGVTFGCFNNPAKLTDAQFATWARVLAQTPGSRLLLKGRDFEEAAVREHLLQRMGAQGIPRDRLELVPRTDGTAEHLALYGRVDIALDTFPYHGTTTTCEALWMGVPVVTLSGDRHKSRVGVSLLHAAGHPEWIAKNADDYVRIASELARDPARLAQLRASLRTDLQRGALLDHAGQAARFGAALRECWAAYCARRTPQANAA